MAVVVQAGNLKNGISIEFEGNIYQVLEFQHVKPGKGPAFVRTKLRNMKTGSIIDKTFRPQDRFEQAVIERKDMQYLYSDGELFHFMDQESFEQIALNAQDLGDALKFVKENDVVMMLSHNGVILGVEPPISVELTVTHTEPGIKGDTATGATKPAELETGAVVMVPLFINNGDKLKIDTRTGEYVSRV